MRKRRGKERRGRDGKGVESDRKRGGRGEIIGSHSRPHCIMQQRKSGF